MHTATAATDRVTSLQIYVLGWPVPEARGALGMVFPWLIKSESLHYGYALVMLTGLWMLRSGFTGKVDHFWWMTALWIQFFHHIEHGILQTQAGGPHTGGIHVEAPHRLQRHALVGEGDNAEQTAGIQAARCRLVLRWTAGQS